jgi:hypothetical protein
VALQDRDLLVQQVALDQRLAELGLEPVALKRLAGVRPGRQGGFPGRQEGVVSAGRTLPKTGD